MLKISAQKHIKQGQLDINIQIGKFHAEMTNTTPSGSGTISAEDGKVVIEVLA